MHLACTKTSTGNSWTQNCAAVWIMLSSWFVAGGIFLSCINQLNRQGNAILLFVGLAGSLYAYRRLNGTFWPSRTLKWRRFEKPFPFLYLLCVIAILVGGAIHPPTNYDAFNYRIPRLLHWLSSEKWLWIEAYDARKNFSSTGFEWLMLPSFATFQTLRFVFLINVVSYLLLPGLIFSVFSALGVKKSIAATWMWILPCASCFVMEAGGIGNDFIAAVYMLAALLFTFRAIQCGRPFYVVLAIFSAALMTGAKASNLPLLLPVSICMVALFHKRPKLIPPAALAGCFATVVSLLPLAIVNIQHTGDWTGSPDSNLKLRNPVIGLAGNSLLLISSSLSPAIFPPANNLNKWLNDKTSIPPLNHIKEGFPEFKFTVPQIASEENSGLGLGVCAALLLGLAGCDFHKKKFLTLGGAVCAGFWIALLVYMMKLGNCGAPRLVAPYYAGLIALPLLLIRSGRVFSQRWWRWCSLIMLLPILPALAISPARPLLPMAGIVEKIKSTGISNATLDRMEMVYKVYASRSDAHHAVRDLLPDQACSIGFAGTGDESEYSFWLPLGVRTVRDLVPLPGGKLQNTVGLDAIVTSDWGCNDRFKMTPGQLASNLGWRIIGSSRVRTYASGEDSHWSVLAPKQPETHE